MGKWFAVNDKFSLRAAGTTFFAALTLTIALTLSTALQAQGPALTTIGGTVYRADGTPASGNVLISWPSFQTAEGDAVAAGNLSVTIGPLGVFRVRATPLAIPSDIKPYGPGAYDDMLEGVEHNGAWIFDRQFAEAAQGTLTYSDTRGDALRLQFSGTGVVYVYTKTFNRGIAQVLIDGVEKARLNQYAPRTIWQVSSTIGGLAPGTHTFELRVTGEKDARSKGRYVDFDGFVVTD